MLERPSFTSYIDLLVPYKQKYEYSCGPASLKMLYECYGLKISEQEIIEDTVCEEHGIDWQAVLTHIYDMDFDFTFKTRAGFEDLRAACQLQKVPVLISWNPTKKEDMDHFSVVKRVSSDSLIIADPAEGSFVTLSKQKFMKRWYGAGKEQPMLFIRERTRI